MKLQLLPESNEKLLSTLTKEQLVALALAILTQENYPFLADNLRRVSGTKTGIRIPADFSNVKRIREY